MDLREEFNSCIKRRYKNSHTPQCAKCQIFVPWGQGCMEIHHIKPLVYGGTNDYDNLITLCTLCHSEWHTYYDEGRMDFRLWLQKPPLWAYAAMAKIDDKTTRFTAFMVLEDYWWMIQDHNLTASPYDTEEKREYVKAHSSEWIDW